MVAATEQPLLREYDDGPDWPIVNRAKEQAYRQGFLEGARHIVKVWAHPPGPPKPDPQPVSVRKLIEQRRCDPFAEVEAAWQLRRRVRERFAVYGRGDAGRKTYHLGYRPGHAVAAARLRGRHHAMAYVTSLWEDLDTADLDIFDPKLLCPWLRAVEAWASAPIRPNVIAPPPRPTEVTPVEELVSMKRGDEPTMDAPAPPAPALLPPPPPPRQIKLTRADQIEMRPPHWLLRGMLERDTFALVFGDPGCGKSFLAIDWACRIATGTPWRSQAVKGGPVVYIAGEGQQGFGRRIRAWSQHHGVSLADVPLYLAPAVAMPNPTDLMALATAIDAGVVNVGKPALIVLDTLARCFGGGDENSTQDMNRFVLACDAIRQRYGCTILVVHHAGHGDKTRARGAIALKAALDAEYRLANDDRLLLTATKVKDAETPPPLALRLVTVELPDLLDDYGNPVTSAAIEVVDADTGALVSQAKAAMSGKWQKTGLKIAQRLIAEGDDGQASVSDWHKACEAAGMRQSTRYSVLAKLHEQGLINVDGDVMSTV
ncbi:MAG TPA: helicase RepA family protein [Phycisphaerae bacterium]|nr:helicase RepA family protein [Phycisphaerae bacterium]